MDKTETDSSTSEDPHYSSNASSISGLTGYEDEINEIKSFIRLTNSGGVPTPKSSPEKVSRNIDVLSYELRIKNLNLELQNALKLNEKYKNDLFRSEKRNDLECHDKFGKLIKKNAVLEAQLHNANLHIESILKNSAIQNGKIKPDFNEKYILLEKRNCELEAEKSSLVHEIEQRKLQITNNITHLEKIKLELRESHEENHIKQKCIEELKNKITEQHIELQNVNRKAATTHNNLVIVENELKTLNKSMLWYKEQLHICQNEKNKITEECFELRNSLTNINSKNEHLNSELKEVKLKYKEKQTIYKEQNENLKQKMKQLEKNLFNGKEISATEDIFSMRQMHEDEVEAMNVEIAAIKKSVLEQTILFQKISKENAELIARNTTMQKGLNDKELQLEIFKKQRKDHEKKLEELSINLKQKEDLLVETQGKISKLNLALTTTQNEKEEISEAILLIRNDFQKFSLMYKKLKDEVNDKNKQILELQQGRQEMFMQKNWNICEIEEFKNREKEYLQRISELSKEKLELSSRIKFLESSESHIRNEFKRTNDNILDIRNQKEILEKANKDLSTRVASLTKDLNDSLQCHENDVHKINFYKSSLEELNSQLKEKEYYKSLFIKFVEILCQKYDEILQNNFTNENFIKDMYGNNNLVIDKNLMEMLDKLDYYLVTFYKHYKALYQKVEELKIIEKSKKKLEVKVENLQIGKEKVYWFKKKLLERLNEVENRSSFLRTKCEANENLLQNVKKFLKEKNGYNQSGDESIRNLQTLLKAKDLELLEKQKRYEVNNRTLLRKLKEHMRGRNSAEKSCKYLQELYNNTSEALNTTKLCLSQKEFEIDEFNNTIEMKNRALEKLQNSVLNMEKELAMRKLETCDKCVENEVLRSTVVDLEERLLLAESKADEYFREFKVKDQSVQMLKNQMTALNGLHEILMIEHAKCVENLSEASDNVLKEKMNSEKLILQIEEKEKVIQDLKKYQDVSMVEYSNCQNEIKTLRMELSEVCNQNDFYCKELEVLNLNLHKKNEELALFQSQKQKREVENFHHEKQLKDLLNKSEEDARELRESVKILAGEKYFLQRLCNDLKIALNSAVNQNKILKEKLTKQLNDVEFHSLPQFMSSLPSPSAIDDTKINNLLKKTDVLNDKPFATLHESLKSLKREMASLQQQISEKKFAASSL